jgi:uncharacterized protein YkwD
MLQVAIMHFAQKKDLFAAMNAVRTNPKSLIPDLKKRLKWFDGDTMYRPGEKVGLTTNEGPTAVLELIKFLEHADPLPKMGWSNGLSKTCQDFSDWAGPKGKMGHTGPTVGEQMWDRASKHGQWSGMVGENLSYGSKNGKDAMIQLLIDDGVASRGHRKNIFSANYKLVGVGIQTHKKYKWMTCTNFATAFDTKVKEKPWVKCAGCPLPKTETPESEIPSTSNDGDSNDGTDDSNQGEQSGSSGDEDGWTTTENSSSSSGDWDSFRN